MPLPPDVPTPDASDPDPRPPASTAAAEAPGPEAPPPGPRPRRMSLLLVAITWLVAFEWVLPDEGATPFAWWFGYAGAFVALALSAVVLTGREPGGLRSLVRGATPAWYGRACLTTMANHLALGIAFLFVLLLGRTFVAESKSGPADVLLASTPFEDPRQLHAFLALVVFAPILEEVFFRGLLLRALRQYVPTGWAVALSALAFGLVHPAFTPQLVGGILYGLLAVESGSVLPGMLAHAAGNFASRSATGGFASLWAGLGMESHPLASLPLLAALMVAVLVHALAIVRGRPRRSAWNVALIGLAVACIALTASRRAAHSRPDALAAAAHSGVRKYVAAGGIEGVADGPDAAFDLPGLDVRLPALPGDTLEVVRYHQVSGPVKADSEFVNVALLFPLGGRSRRVAVEREGVGPVRIVGDATSRLLARFAGGRSAEELLGFGDRVTFGPETRDDPPRVVETRGFLVRPADGAAAEAIVWVPLRRDYLGFQVDVGDSTQARGVLEDLDARVRQLQFAPDRAPRDRRPTDGPFEAWSFELGRVHEPLGWALGPGPNVLVLVAALIALVIDYARHGRRRAPSTPEPAEASS